MFKSKNGKVSLEYTNHGVMFSKNACKKMEIIKGEFPYYLLKVKGSNKGKYLIAYGSNGDDRSEGTCTPCISRNFGKTWHELFTSKKFNFTSVRDKLASLGISPNADFFVFISKHGDCYTSRNSFIWKTIDYKKDNFSTQPGIFKSVAVSNKNIFSATWGGNLFKSNDFCLRWMHLHNAGVKPWRKIRCSNDGKIVAAIADNALIMVSNDGGNNWTETLNVKNVEGDNSILEMSLDGKTIAYFNNGQELYISTDYGKSWIKRYSNYKDCYVLRNYDFWINTSGQNIEFLVANLKGANTYLVTTKDYGESWKEYRFR